MRACVPAVDTAAVGGRDLRLRSRRHRRCTDTSGCENPSNRDRRGRLHPVPGPWLSYECSFSYSKSDKLFIFRTLSPCGSQVPSPGPLNHSPLTTNCSGGRPPILRQQGPIHQSQIGCTWSFFPDKPSNRVSELRMLTPQHRAVQVRLPFLAVETTSHRIVMVGRCWNTAADPNRIALRLLGA